MDYSLKSIIYLLVLSITSLLFRILAKKTAAYILSKFRDRSLVFGF
jgi:hypothetical protein